MTWYTNAISVNTAKAIGRRDNWELVAADKFDDVSNLDFYYATGATPGAAAPAFTATANQLSSGTATTGEIVAYPKGLKLADGRVQVVYENPDSTVTNWAGIALRSTATRKDMLLVLFFNGNPGRVDIWKNVGGALTQLATVNLSTADVALTTGVPLSLEAEVIGNTVKVYVNGRLVLTSAHADIANYMYGPCGLIADKTRNALFSNLSVRRRRYDVVPPTVKSVLCIGSSITFGYKLGSQMARPYPQCLQDRLNQEFATQAVTVVNSGVSGNTTADMLTRLPGLISASSPDVVIIETSVNDTKKTAPVAYDTTIANLRQMIKLAKQAGAVPLISTATPLNPAINQTDWDVTSWRRVYQLNARVRMLAGEECIRLIENADAFNNDLTLLSDDLHPNDNGAQKMADTAFDTIVGKA